MRRLALVPLALALSTQLVSAARADEGQWTPDQMATVGEKLKELGFTVKADALWDESGDETNGGLLRAVVNLSGCSAAFVSPNGLVATNHHCAFAAVQANSNPEHDYIKHGFVAKTHGEELEAKGSTVKVLRKVEDVTARMRGIIDAASDDRARAVNAERERKAIVDACEASAPGLRCDVAAFDHGAQFKVFHFVELTDVRLVYAPPSMVGEYGGEIDNWMWPRHTGDFALLRAYVKPDGSPAPFAADNVPYKPTQWLKPSTEGVRPGDPVAVLGYPGRTRRTIPAPEVMRQIEQVLPAIVDVYGEWIEILEKHAARDKAVAIKVAATKKSLFNRHKNSRGMLDGMAYMDTAKARTAERDAIAEKASETDKTTLTELDEAVAVARAAHDRDMVLGTLVRAPLSLAIAVDLVRKQREVKKPDLERVESYRERNAARLWKQQEGRLRDFDREADAELLAFFLARHAALPPAQQVPAIAKQMGGLTGKRDAFLELATKLVTDTRVTDAKLLDAGWKGEKGALPKADPMLALAEALVPAIEQMEAEGEARTGTELRLWPKWVTMLDSVRPQPRAPDANGTLRVSLASVRGYAKRDGSEQKPTSTLAEAVVKHTGQEPFDLPEPVRAKADAAKTTAWAEPTLGDLQLCFLASGDTTGGNSGSPVVDGQGRLVGFNFDRVWENIAGDYAYDIRHSRNIIADVRFLFWMLDAVHDAGPILEELGVAGLRGKTLAAPPTTGPTNTASPATARDIPPGGGCDCDASGGSDPQRGVTFSLLSLTLGCLLRRRRRG
jgi:hypothetical protein